ncbi:anthranilate phosphoribosyltransferase [Arboricoccus pini]|nr:anthranilate phosphoribosyltransferase [Arboricoccus pini]
MAAQGQPLSFEVAREAFDLMMAGEATPAQIAGLLMAMRVRGESVDEMTAGAMAMRERMLRLKAPADAIDVVGTGGDAAGTFNISTASAFVIAGAGVTVAKHGNRNLSSRSGSADVLIALGVNIDCPFPQIERAIAEAGLGFMMAPRHHGAMRHVAGPRSELGTRTIFNLLGPLTNPAGVRRQLVGVFAPEWVEPVARALAKLGSERAWVVHGLDGLDELTTTGSSLVTSWDGQRFETFEVTPEDAGLMRARPEDLKGGDPTFNAKAIRAMLAGEPGPLRDAAVMGAAGALVVAGRATSLREGAELAAQSIASGRARHALNVLVEISRAESAN